MRQDTTSRANTVWGKGSGNSRGRATRTMIVALVVALGLAVPGSALAGKAKGPGTTANWTG